MYRLLLITSLLLLTAACSIPTLDEVLSDQRTEYKKSEPLPPLDVPPDLATSEPNAAMTIPGETTTATYKDYKNQTRKNQTATDQETATTQAVVTTTTAATIPTTDTTVARDSEGGSFVAVRGEKQDIWNRLRTFMTGKGYQLDLDDYELGYLETQWSAPQTEDGLTYRHKFKLYSEPGAEAGLMLLFIDNARQEQAVQGNGNTIWVERDKSTAAEQLLAGEMNVYFNGRQQQSSQPQTTNNTVATAPAPATPARTSKALTEIQNIGDGKILLAIAEEYTLAWRHTGQALQSAGMVINSKDQEQGVYHITYNNPKVEQSGWTSKLKKLKFWGRDQQQATTYQIALSGVRDKTELVLLRADGEWETSEAAENILNMIQTYYNR